MLCTAIKQKFDENQLKAVFQNDSIWPNDSTIRVAFIGGEEWQHAWIEKVVSQELQPLIGLQFVWNHPDPYEAEISIELTDELVASSLIGRYSAMETPSMYLGWIDPPFGSFEFKGKTYNVPHAAPRNKSYKGPITTGATVLHEFGHALGMIHEHQNPFGEPIQWDENRVIQVFQGPPNNWSVEDIRFNILDYVPESLHNGSEFDPESIMIYSFPADYTLNRTEDIRLPDSLSDTDKQWLRKMYPIQQHPEYEWNSICDSNCTVTDKTCVDKLSGAIAEDRYCRGKEARCDTCKLVTVRDCDGALHCVNDSGEMVDLSLCDQSGMVLDTCDSMEFVWSECVDGSQWVIPLCDTTVHNIPNSLCSSNTPVIRTACSHTPGSAVDVTDKIKNQYVLLQLNKKLSEAKTDKERTDIKSKIKEVRKKYKNDKKTDSGSSWILWVLGAILVAILYGYLFNPLKQPKRKRFYTFVPPKK